MDAELILIDGKMFGYHITPMWGKVQAEIYYLTESIIDLKGRQLEIHCISKSFKRLFKEIDESDYIRATEWAKNHINYIKNANK